MNQNNTHRRLALLICLGALALFTFVGAANSAEEPVGATTDVMELSIEELMSIEITSVSKRPEKMWDAASAIYVITQEDIRRSGMTSIPELLRMVPGLQVAKIDANKWAITSRGFADQFANKLLVLMDGRSVYTEAFSGVYWNVQDTFLEDIDRIEVIRGPGATVWGANAVNGVINIITKSSEDTQGGLLPIYAGTEERVFSVRQGGPIGKLGSFRYYAKYREQEPGHLVFHGLQEPGPAVDWWHEGRAGFRIDQDIRQNDSLTVEGDIYSQGAGGSQLFPNVASPPGTLVTDQTTESGGNIMANWRRTRPTVESELLFYYDGVRQNNIQYRLSTTTLDLEYQQHITSSKSHNVVWGMTYRYVLSNFSNSDTMRFTPAARGTNLVSAFGQDDITLVDKRLHLIMGSKFEHNSYTGFEVQPSIRMLWSPGKRQSVWTSVSRAVRTPSRCDRDMWTNMGIWGAAFGFPVVVTGSGSPTTKSEVLLATEIGYRIQPSDRVSIDLATYCNRYNKLRTWELGTYSFDPFPVPHVIAPLTEANKGHASTYGAEMSVRWEPMRHWRIDMGYTWFRINTGLDASSTDTVSNYYQLWSPTQQIQLRSYIDLPGGWEFDVALYNVSRLPYTLYMIPPYNRLDMRLAYKPNDNLEVSLGVNNLLDKYHKEFITTLLECTTDVRRNAYATVSWKF